MKTKITITSLFALAATCAFGANLNVTTEPNVSLDDSATYGQLHINIGADSDGSITLPSDKTLTFEAQHAFAGTITYKNFVINAQSVTHKNTTAWSGTWVPGNTNGTLTFNADFIYDSTSAHSLYFGSNTEKTASTFQFNKTFKNAADVTTGTSVSYTTALTLRNGANAIFGTGSDTGHAYVKSIGFTNTYGDVGFTVNRNYTLHVQSILSIKNATVNVLGRIDDKGGISLGDGGKLIINDTSSFSANWINAGGGEYVLNEGANFTKITSAYADFKITLNGDAKISKVVGKEAGTITTSIDLNGHNLTMNGIGVNGSDAIILDFLVDSSEMATFNDSFLLSGMTTSTVEAMTKADTPTLIFKLNGADANFVLNEVSTGVYVNLAVVPEPAEWAVIFGAIALGFALYRRRK